MKPRKPPATSGIHWTHDKNRGGQWWGRRGGVITNHLPDYILTELPVKHPLRVEIEGQQ